MKTSNFLFGALPALLAVCIISCSKSDVPTPDTGNPGGGLPGVVSGAPLLDSVIEAEQKGSINWLFKYNADSTLNAQLITNDAEDIPNGYFFTYSGGKLTRINYAETGNVKDTLATDRQLITYDAKGRPALIYNGENGFSSKDSLVYNDNNQLIRTFSYSDGKLSYQDTLTWTGNNVTKIVSRESMSGSTETFLRTMTYRYDDKKNPYASVRAAMFTEGEINWLSENNVVELVEKTSLENTEWKTTYTYVYNDKNYPVSSTWKGDSDTQTGSIRFVYKK
ncbi:hypothetical protein [Chitinophaga sp. sic0106]|uniref:hypothetical protein n=1 Tax=Chitinophaga sp. sic0106 TaxID=2854785 RepID=UPI001C47BA7F|nr:hypothetical protein [Chitinophaga sp. sic0106]MBV7533712.1 hypothetical protein [Chitinophaga sp. sic0106]